MTRRRAQQLGLEGAQSTVAGRPAGRGARNPHGRGTLQSDRLRTGRYPHSPFFSPRGKKFGPATPSTTIRRLMPSTRNHRWIWAVFFVTVFPATAIHFSCVAVLGPGSWGSGVEEKEPLVEAAGERPDLAPYVEQWKAARDAGPVAETSPPWVVASLGDREGDVVWADRVADNGDAVVLTAGGGNWTEQQRLFVSRGTKTELREVEIPAGMILRHPTLLKSEGQTRLIVGRWNSWAVPPMQKLSRYSKSWFNSTLRPEHSLFAYDDEMGAFENARSRRRSQTLAGPITGRNRAIRRARDDAPQPARLGARLRDHRDRRLDQRG